ncbi:uncharacterized protein LOC112536432 [Ricinus communis]|uniref:uncharacterized protein LOC112536432 n=1 Tax=Ricinus communis TaxID=3988 RepID=UPI00201A3A51|nr:uncharacterized protein LOC112536432 [Ricinus communis]
MFCLYCSKLSMNKSTSLFLKVRYFSTENLDYKKSFAVSYLVNSCGFTSETAKTLSKWVHFDTPEKPNSVLMFFKDQGFNNSQISRIVKERPQVLLADPKSSLLPKLEFLRSMGASSSDLSIIVSKNAHLLCRSLERYLIPCCDILKSALVSDDEKVIKTLKRMSTFSMPKLLKYFTVNLSFLREIGVPLSAIPILVANYTMVMCRKVSKFTEGVEKLMKMGFDPSKQSFVWELPVFLLMSNKTWQHKVEVYRRWGISKDEFWSIFKKQPLCMNISEKNVMTKMHFFVCEMGWRPADIVRVPTVLCYNLEARIIPRCSVVRVLLLKGLIKDDIPVSSVLIASEKVFLKRFVMKHLEEVPQLLDLFQGKVSLAELGFGFDEKSGNLGHATYQS